MKATELMIGDWVHNSYHKKNIQWNYGEMFCPNRNPVIGKDLYPIPLFPEILEKNGFEIKEILHQYGWSIFYENRLILSKVKFDYEIQINNFPYKIRYVHELQHVLRLCGFNDLADNFKL